MSDGYIELFAAMIEQLTTDMRISWEKPRDFQAKLDGLKHKNQAWRYVIEDPDFECWLEYAGIDPIAGRAGIIARGGKPWNYKWGELLQKWLPYTRVPVGRPKEAK